MDRHTAALAAHGAQHPVRDVLERHVEVGADGRFVGHDLEQLVGDRRRVRVEQPEPADVGHADGESPEQPGERGVARQVAPVGGQVLRDQGELDRTLRREARGLGDEVVHRTALVPATDLRDDAEAAGVVAAFRDLEIGRPPGARPDAGRHAVRGQHVLRAAVDDGRVRERRLDRVGDPEEVSGANEHVDLGQRLLQVVGVALREAAGHDEPPSGPRRLHGGEVEDRVDRLLLGGPDEGAGVDDEHVGGVGVEHHLVAAARQHAEHDLAVHLVLRTAEGHEVHAARRHRQSRKFTTCIAMPRSSPRSRWITAWRSSRFLPLTCT